LKLSADGGFTYRPNDGFQGLDSFTYAVLSAGHPSPPVRVSLAVPGQGTAISGTIAAPSTSAQASSPPPATWRASVADVFAVPSTDSGVGGIAFGSLGLLGMAFNWLVPGVAMTVPGLLLLLAILAQALGGLAWLPTVRRRLGDFGLRGLPGAFPHRSPPH
jgi:hypothetical protein